MRSHKDERIQRSKQLNEDRSACLVSNLSEFRSPICHHVDLASMGMHPKFCKLRIVPGNLKTLPTWNPCLVRGEVVLGVEAVLSTGAILEAVPTVYCRLKQCLQEQCFVDRSHVVATAILEVVRVDKGKMLSTEQCCVDRNILGGRSSSWGGLECLSGRPGSLSACLSGLGACLDGLGPV